MSVKLLTEHCLELLSLKGGCTGSNESTLVKITHCWKSHAAANLLLRSLFCLFLSGRFTQVLLYASSKDSDEPAHIHSIVRAFAANTCKERTQMDAQAKV